MANLTLKNFEEHISKSIIEAGFSFFADDKIEDLQKLASGTWAAQAIDDEIYVTSVWTNRTIIKSWECGCSENTEICKHVAACFYAIKEEAGIKNDKGKASRSPVNIETDKINAIFKKISKNELIEFLNDQFSNQKKWKSLFIAKFIDYLDVGLDEKYKTILKNQFKSLKGEYGYLDSKSTNKLVKSHQELINQAGTFLNAGNSLECIAICKALIEEIPIFLISIYNDDKGLIKIFDSAFEMMGEISKKAPPMLKDELFDFVIDEVNKEKYIRFSIEERFFELLPRFVTTHKQEKKFFEIINQQIEILINRIGEDSYVAFLVKIKTDYLNSIGKKQDADDLLHEFIYLQDCRRIIVEKAIEEHKIEKAKTLITEGIRIAQKDKWQYQMVLFWQSKLLEIAIDENDKLTIIKLSEQLFFESDFNFDFYFVLRENIEKKNWKEKVEGIIDKIRDSINVKRQDNLYPLANIYAVEKMYDRLLKLLKLNAHYSEFIDDFSKYLIKDYKNELLDIYEKTILILAKEPKKSIYRQMRKLLLNMNEIDGAKNKVNQVLSVLRQNYKNRSAMMNLLNEKFPESNTLKKEKENNNQLDLF